MQSLTFPYEFQDSLALSMKNVMNVSTEIPLGSIDILTILIILMSKVPRGGPPEGTGISLLPHSLSYAFRPSGCFGGAPFVKNKVFS